jgi:hypothetical protein
MAETSVAPIGPADVATRQHGGREDEDGNGRRKWKMKMKMKRKREDEDEEDDCRTANRRDPGTPRAAPEAILGMVPPLHFSFSSSSVILLFIDRPSVISPCR